MSLISSTSTVLHYAISGDVDYALSGIIFIVGFSGGLVGRLTALYVSEKLKRYSVLIFTLATVLFISFWLIVYHLITEENDFVFHNLC